MPTAIVTGATGILGREIVAELAKSPDRWTKVHALSRSKKDEYPPNVVHGFIDLQASAEEMAKELKDVKGEYVFFAAYLQRDSEKGNWDVNGDMLQNFLTALESIGAVEGIKRIILVTGCKQYGVHLGQPKNPMYETDPWLRHEKFPPNFYYRQQDILHAFARKHSHVSWVVTYPNVVIGFAKGNFMNFATGIGIYAAITKELNGGKEGTEIVFPGSPTFYTKFESFTSSKLHASFCAWAATAPEAANQAFNVINGDVESWQNLFPLLARRYGLRVKPDQFSSGGDEGGSSTADLAPEPPVSVLASDLGLVGAVPPGKLEMKVDLVKWSRREDVRRAWATLAEREGLEKDALDKATWRFLGFVLGRNFDIVASMSKARKRGWTGYKDTWESFTETFDELEKEKILPKSR